MSVDGWIACSPIAGRYIKSLIDKKLAVLASYVSYYYRSFSC